MNTYKADLHIHTVLSPCGDLTMSPAAIVEAACSKGLDIIGITDHNTTRHCPLVKKLASKHGLFVLMGVEINTKEEVHCLAFFENEDILSEFQHYIDEHLPEIPNNPDTFGYQVQVDENEDIIYEESRLLVSALDQSLDQVEHKVHELGGIFMLAHIDKGKNSIISQLGFIPSDLNYDALGLSPNVRLEGFIEKNKYLKGKPFIQNSDAHIPHEVGKVYTNLQMEHRSFDEFLKAIRNEQGRGIGLV